MRLFILLYIFICLFFSNYATNSEFNEKNVDTTQLGKYKSFIEKLNSSEEIIKYATKALILSRSQNNEKYVLYFSKVLADQYFQEENYNNSISFYNEALNTAIQLNDFANIAEIKNNLGRIYEKRSMYDKAIKYYIEALKIKEKLNDKKGIASLYNSIGLIYYYQANSALALKNFNTALTIAQEIDLPLAIASIYNNIGLLYIDQRKFDSALVNFNKSLSFYEKINNLYGISTCYSNLGICYYSKNDLLMAEKYFNNAISIKEEIEDNFGLVSTYISLAVLYQKKKDYDKALDIIEKAINISSKLDYKEGLSRAYFVQSELFSQKGDYKKAYEQFIKYHVLQDSIFNEKNTKTISSLQEQYQAEKREKEIELANSKIKQQSILIYAALLVIALVLSLSFVILRSYRQKKKANELLSAQNIEIIRQKNIIEEKNRDILSSITYAKRIQDAILPQSSFINKYLTHTFVLYLPKDIVSGDFYWFMPLSNDVILFAVVDCTGHGVPGAFMSIVGYNSLNQVIKEFSIHNPALILDKLNELVQQALHTQEQEIKDGMDIALCWLNIKERRLRYAGANNPLYIISNDGTKNYSPVVVDKNNKYLYEIKANNQPIGAYVTQKKFNCHEFLLSENEEIVIFSDGYADQFGGHNGKKLKYKKFKELLLDNYTFSPEEQKNNLLNFIEEWKGTQEQIDDICVWGIKII